MPTDVKQPPNAPGAPAPAQAQVELAHPDTPVLVKRDKKGKRKYTRGLRDLQRWERGYAKASRSLGRAFAAGLDTYYKRRNKSSYKRRDGAVRDALKNWTKATGKMISKASDAPYDLVKALDSRSVRRTMKFFMRSLSSPFLR